MVLGNYVTRRLCREVGWLHDVGEFDAVLAAASRSVEGSRCGHALTGWVGHHRVSGCGLAGEDTDVVKTAPQQDAGDDEEQDAADEPYGHCQLPAGSVVTFAAVAQSAEHLALFPHRIGSLTRHTQEVGSLREEIGQVCAGLTDRDTILIHEAFALVAHEQAVPVGVVHDAVEGVNAGGGGWPAHPGWGGGDVVDCNHHCEKMESAGMKCILSYCSCLMLAM